MRYDVGDCEIAVEWFERDVSGGDERRTFRAWTADKNANEVGPSAGHTYTFNSTELRLISNPNAAAGAAVQLEMQVLPPVGGVALNLVQQGVVRSSARTTRSQSARPNYRNVVYRKTTTRARDPEQLWEITTGSERVVLDNCW